MQTIRGKVQFTGKGPAHSKVDLVDAMGELICKASADIHGVWSVAKDMPLGEHIVQAICRRGDDVVATSDDLEILVEPEESADAAALREYAFLRYREMLLALADGAEMAAGEVERIVESAGKTFEEFDDDMAGLLEAEQCLADAKARLREAFNEY